MFGALLNRGPRGERLHHLQANPPLLKVHNTTSQHNRAAVFENGKSRRAEVKLSL